MVVTLLNRVKEWWVNLDHYLKKMLISAGIASGLAPFGFVLKWHGITPSLAYIPFHVWYMFWLIRRDHREKQVFNRLMQSGNGSCVDSTRANQMTCMHTWLTVDGKTCVQCGVTVEEAMANGHTTWGS